YSTIIQSFRPLNEHLRKAKRIERMRHANRLQANRIMQPAGNGWALVGDAGYHKDPITALGISDAFRDASLLATAVGRVFNLGWPESIAYARYAEERADAIRALFSFTVEIGRIVARGRAAQFTSNRERMEAGEQ